MKMIERFEEYEGKKFRYLASEENGKAGILLMHGYNFYAEIWKECGLLDMLSDLGYGFISLDVPGFPRSQSKFRLSTKEFKEFLNHVIGKHFSANPVILGSSASGFLALDYATSRGNIKAVIAVAPVNIRELNLSLIKIPVLGIWGSLDTVSDPSSSELIRKLRYGRAEIIEGAGHACYLDKPEEFNRLIREFLNGLRR
ncbi:MAG: alpha/beta fold hydrolase [Thermoplasmata archaeon]